MAEEHIDDDEGFTIYVRGTNESREDKSSLWDDRALNDAYDKALKIANVEVARRLAMETNSNQSGSKTTKAKEKTVPRKPNAIAWKQGMACRAIYEDDGLEYEAVIVHIVNDKNCIVKFLGYNNEEKVPLSALKRSLGDESRSQQINEAAGDETERIDDESESQPSEDDVDQGSDGLPKWVPVVRNDTESSRNKKKKSNENQKSSNTGRRHPDSIRGLPSLPMPTANMFRNMEDAEMPFPPPPPMLALSSGRSDADEQAISDMLLSWYMTGYYTGLYQGRKRQGQGRRTN